MKQVLRVLNILWMGFVLNQLTYSQGLIPSDKEELLNGNPQVYILLAERNGFPSPSKILSMKDQLGLTKDQVRKIEEMIANLPVAVTVKGQEIIEAEENLNQLFQSENINEKTLRSKLERIGKLRAELHFSHLQAYLKVKQILSVNQWQKYKDSVASEVK
jgi:Spy/CpxP family protein refolding chaperone